MQWRRIDLHIHTPGSKDYENPEATYLDILRKAEAEGIDIVAFTDHNTVSGYAAMKREIEDLERWEKAGRIQPAEQDRLAEYRRLQDSLLVLPGFEFTATFGFHILAIFDLGMPIRAIEHVLLDLGVPLESLEQGEMNVGATTDVLAAYRVMAEAGALVIAAHANSSNGVAMVGLGFGGQTKIAYTQDPNLHALEVTDLESRRRRTTAAFFNGSKPEYPRRMHCIQGSDAHRIQGQPASRQNLGVGERATEVLLPEVSFAALKELFLSREFHRVRPCRRTAEPFDFVEEARKEGPNIVLSFHEQITRQGGRLHAIVRDVVAFANGNGGTIYIGVSSNTKTPPKGVENPEKAIKELRAEIGRQVTPPIEVSTTVLKSRGKNIVRVEVPAGSDPPYAMEGSKIYLRREDETNLAMRDEIVDLIRRITMAASLAGEIAPAPVPVRLPDSRKGKQATSETGRSQPSPSQPAPSHSRKRPSQQRDIEAPRTGVEIVDSVQRDGVLYHTMRDLRDGTEVHNVTRQSARRLWRYAIALKEKGTFQEDKVAWVGDQGLWHKYLRAGKPHYDLVQRQASGDVRIFYGVSEQGIDGPWRNVVGQED